jgi:hypothetical protein
MNHPLPGPTPGPRPGPRPEATPVEPAHAVDPDEIRQRVADLLEQADDVASADGQGLGLQQLARQAELLDRAHTVLTEALEKVDRV